MKCLLCALLTLMTIPAMAELAFPGALGFGAQTRGGTGGRILEVTRLDDVVKNPPKGTFRWAVNQKGPRIIKFRVAGTIMLQDTVKVVQPFLTIDGSDAPGLGVCLRGGTLECRDTHDVIVRYIRIRLGDENTLKRNQAQKVKRPTSSNDLDCVTLDHSYNIIFDHCSLSWSCDEIFGIVGCRNVTLQWCLLAEPLALPALHPYGDNHGYGINASASTLSIHHCLIAHYVMRGPQFEANDLRRRDNYAVRMEAVNNVLFSYRRSGSRYTTGVEDHPEQAKGKAFEFQFLNNLYLSKSTERPAIQAVLKHGFSPGIRVAAAGNEPPLTAATLGMEGSESEATPSMQSKLFKGIATQPLFTTTATAKRQSAQQAAEEVLAKAGCNLHRDAVDLRIIDEVKRLRFREAPASQNERGGWPDLTLKP